MKPVIGIPLRYQKLVDNRAIVYMSERMRRTVQLAGGFVYAISPVQNLDNIHTKGNEFPELSDSEKEDINISLDMCDGIIFPGGIKFTPYDRYLFEMAIEKKIPVLGICLGMQMMSCLKKEIELFDVDTGFNHYQESDFELSHTVKICKDSKLFEIIGKEEIMVNSYHNYHATENDVYNVVALSEDGLIEAIEYPGDEYFNIGIQWHPEISYEFDDDSKKLIDAFIDAARCKCKERISSKELV
jgi:putative glutamine amidotransferase